MLFSYLIFLERVLAGYQVVFLMINLIEEAGTLALLIYLFRRDRHLDL
jgi:hypothetical protein